MADQKGRNNAPLIGIIGGRGRMGRMFVRLFEESGFAPPLVCDIDTELSPLDLARSCDVVVVSVPMEVFPGLIAEIGPVMGHDAFLTDLCSLKESQLEYMMRYAACEVAGTHPLFGPHEPTFKGLRAAICPGRGTRWLQWWEGLLRRQGIKTWLVDASKHDETMAWVQALNHFILLSLGKALEEDGISLEQIVALATPSFERQLKIVGRLAHQDPELYATIQMANPYTSRVLSTFDAHQRTLLNAVKDGNRERFIEIFKEVQEFGKKLNEILGQ